jgi:hypothetical protein
MRVSCSALLAGAAALVAAALTIPAIAEAQSWHQMTLHLPGGATETIRYTGNVAPDVHVDSNPFFVRGPAFFHPVFADPVFAAWDRMAADMDRQMAAMLRLPANAGLSTVVLHRLPAGTSSYSVALRSFGDKACTQVTRVVIAGRDAKPQVTSRSSGHCGGAASGAQWHDTSADSFDGTQTIAAHAMVPAEPQPKQVL